MNSLPVQANSTTTSNAGISQDASFCFCIKAGEMRQRPSVALQLSDLTTKANS